MSPTLPDSISAHLADLSESDRREVAALVAGGADPDGAWDRLSSMLAARSDVLGKPVWRRRVCAIAGSSRALSRAIARSPDIIDDIAPKGSVPLQFLGALVRFAGDDLAGVLTSKHATAAFSDALDSIVAGALTGVRSALEEEIPLAATVPFAVIAMGKWGARELNYSSDIDLVFVHDTPDGEDAEAAREAALAVASRLISTLSSATFDGPGIRVDADLRPEGSMGPLSRSIDGYRRYYQDWSEAWELQALLKARFAVGDELLGTQFAELAESVIWEHGLDSEALRGIRRMKEQAENNALPADIKRARGGIRDIEFTVQLLQLVHGKLDTALRMPGTLDALDAMAAHRYLDDDDHALLRDSYLFLRDLEHRVQLWDLRQTHLVPTDQASLERIGRSLGLREDPAAALRSRISEVRGNVRDIHERLYFRPVLDALVGSPTARLGTADATLRLEALGFADINGAKRALEELTSGIDQRSRVMHQMLPLMLDWLSLSPDPDMGLAQLRTLLAHSPDHSNLVSLLHNNPLAGERLCLLLGSGRLLGTLIDRIPEFVPRLADDRLLGDIRDAEAAIERLAGLLDSRPDPDAKVGTIRRFVRRRRLRIAARELLADAGPRETTGSLSDTADAAITGALHMLPTSSTSGLGVIAMGKWGGRELSYESDLDLIYVTAEETDRDIAFRTAGELGRILGEPNRHGDAYQLDADLRPEGKSGPLVRSIASYARYYEEWVEPWEILALTKARPVAGDAAVLDQFRHLVEKVIWEPLVSQEMLYSIRRVKARVESERIPAHEDPDYHLKLGRGGMSDVEFVTQLLQLQHGGTEKSLRVTGTLGALSALRDSGVLTSNDYAALSDAYSFLTRVRLRLHLQTGRIADSLPTDRAALGRLATSLGYDRATELRDTYRKMTRRSRQVFERLFY